MKYQKAKSLETQEWLNTEQDLNLEVLRGNIIVIHVFQMLCPGCVQHSIPQAKKIHERFKKEEVIVLGLHSVFEHHDAMNKIALQAFLHEYKVTFPVAIDLAQENDYLPTTMKKYDLQGTPTLIIIDKQGNLRMKAFGFVDDLEVGLLIGTLLSEDDENN